MGVHSCGRKPECPKKPSVQAGNHHTLLNTTTVDNGSRTQVAAVRTLSTALLGHPCFRNISVYSSSKIPIVVALLLYKTEDQIYIRIDIMRPWKLRITFTQGFRFQKILLQSSISEIQTQNNVINKYRFWYPWFVYLRKICSNKGRIILKQRKFRPIF